MKSRLAWGILGTGRIAHAFANHLPKSRTGRLVAVGSRTQGAADAFGKEYGLERCHGSYEALLADRAVQAVYVSTPHPVHAEWAIKAAEAGKHILCEKPLAMNHAEAMAVVEAARKHGVFLMEAFMYRCHPQTARLVDLVRAGTIGEIRLIEAAFSFCAPFNAASRIWSNALGGGGILDVGCYPVSAARLLAGAAMGRPFAEPVALKGAARLAETGVDELASATLLFPGGILAQLTTGVGFSIRQAFRIHGTKGTITVPQPWLPAREGGETRIVVQVAGRPKPREVVVRTKQPLYAIEADTVAANLRRRQARSPAMSWEDSLGNMRALDRWRQECGVVHEADRPAAWKLTVARRPLRLPSPPPIERREIPGVGKPVSRLVMGVDNQVAVAHASVMFDDYAERGGNAFDTAWIYGGGAQERLLGEWMRSRGVRDEVAVIVKGAHTPCCDPANLGIQLGQSLERLGTDHADLYLMHRDNAAVPAAEFVDALEEHRRAGRVRAWGFSNWSIARVEEARRHAERRGVAGPAALSNNLSLARMVDPVWAGALSVSDAESREWLRRTQTPLLAWSSQARGFFARGNPRDRSDAEMARCWYREDNFERLARVRELARRRKVPPIDVALAWVLHQPFPTFALIGPRTLEETRVSFGALAVSLSPDEVRRLNLEGR
jgi:predicted dehydrogenase/aryl-alcohol dehydrogenase-like predicted oxidoreductase